MKARSSLDENLLYEIGDKPIMSGDLCEKGSQLRPHVVWFGENVLYCDVAREHVENAGRVLVVGIFLTVYPVAWLLGKARYDAEKIIVSLDIEKRPKGYRFMRSRAENMAPHIAACWMEDRKVF